MKRIFATVILLLVFLPARISAETSGWFGGFSLSSEGFVSEEHFEDAEYVGVNLYIEPWTLPAATPSLSVGVLIPAVPFKPEAGMLTAEAGVELFSLREHPFAWAIDLENSWSPLLSVRLMHPFSAFSADSLYTSVALSLFRLKTGSGRFSIMSIAYIADADLVFAGWGVRLFDFRLYLL